MTSHLLGFPESADAEDLGGTGHDLSELQNISFCNIMTNASVLQGCLRLLRVTADALNECQA